MAGQRLYVFLSDESADGWRQAADKAGLPVAALFEAVGLQADTVLTGDVVEAARLVTRRRHPKKRSKPCCCFPHPEEPNRKGPQHQQICPLWTSRPDVDEGAG